jgi:transcriptional regulator with XRE-family HTH domain
MPLLPRRRTNYDNGFTCCRRKRSVKNKCMSNDMRPTYLRVKRRTWSLNQQELADLIGGISRSQISRIEREEKPPSGQVLTACQFLFGCPPEDIFPSLYAAAEDQVMRGAYELYQRVENDQSPKGLAKKEFLDRLLQRAVEHIHSTSNL